jgi:DNA-binding beta-propeller fold protein YncE
MSLAVSSAADRFYVTDVSVPEVSVYDNAGTQLGSVALPLISGGWWLDCVLSPDDATLYVATSYGIVVIDTAALSISAIVPSSGWLHGIAVSPDGATVAAPVAGGELLVLDAAALASTTITLGAGTANVVFADPKRVLTWNPTAPWSRWISPLERWRRCPLHRRGSSP